jgi:iron complex transport system ATP-binding protein
MSIELRDLNLSIGGKAILKGINYAFEPGKLYGLIGPNGSGKSSLLKLFAREIQASSGQIDILARPIEQWPDRDYACKLAVLPQFSQLNFPLSVSEIISFARLPHSDGRDDAEKAALHSARHLDIEHLLQRSYTELSGGEKQRAQLARVLAQLWHHDDSYRGILLLDEPTNSLDIEHQHSLLKILNDIIGDDLCVVSVLHDLGLASRYCNKLLVLDCGQLKASGSPNEVITESLMKSSFNLSCNISPHPELGHPIISV